MMNYQQSMANISLMVCLLFLPFVFPLKAQQQRARELGINIGVLSPGQYNAITDVPEVKVGQITLEKGDSVRTGVTAILPQGGNLFQEKVPAAVFTGNGFPFSWERPPPACEAGL